MGLGSIIFKEWRVTRTFSYTYKPITNTAWVRARLCKLQKGCTLLEAASDKAYQLLAHGRWFSPASSTAKTGHHDVAEILLKVALNTNNQTINQITLVQHLHYHFSTHVCFMSFIVLFYVNNNHSRSIYIRCSFVATGINRLEREVFYEMIQIHNSSFWHVPGVWRMWCSLFTHKKQHSAASITDQLFFTSGR